MSDYAIIATGGKQYRVRPGDTITVEKLDGNAGASIEFVSVLLAAVDGDVKIGSPTLKGAKVTGEISAQKKGEKLIHFRWKNKTHGGSKRGHRQSLTDVTIKSISAK
jgi:large subunit ribosomal protein L21